MKKITLIFFLTLLSFCSYGQLALQEFEGTWSPAAPGTSTTGWFQFQNSVGVNIKWAQSPLNVANLPPYEGSHAAYLQRDNVATGSAFPEDYLVTPQFNVPLEPELRFFSRLTITGDYGSIYKVFIIDLTTTPGADLNTSASYVELESWTELEINPEQTDYNEVIVPIPAAYIGKDVRIAFMMTGDEMDRWLIDNVKVVKKCVAPLNLTSANPTLTSADLSWENPSGSTKWEIEVVGEDDVPLAAGIEYTGTLPYHVTTMANGTPLAEDTCYKYYVRSLCDGGGESDWAGAFYFCTKKIGDNCSFPIVVNTLPFSDEDDTANFADDYNGLPGTGCGNQSWEDYLSGNDVVYQYTATFTGFIDIDLSENGVNAGIFVYNECSNIGSGCLDGGVAGWDGNPVSLEDFPVVNGEDYYIVISSYSEPSTPYQLIIQAVACDEPTNLSVGTTGLTTATLSWDNPSGATSWQVAVQTAGSNIPSGAGTTVTDNSDYLWTTGLVASTAYQYWVRADCGNGAFSAWAGPFEFNTQICDTPFQCAFTFTMWDVWNNWDGHTMAVKQNGLTIATLTGPGDDGEPVTVTVPVCNSMPVQLFWNNGGSTWASADIGVSVKNSFNQTIYVKEPGDGTPGTQLYEVVVDCDKPYCLPPEGLTATNITQTTADLGWVGDATGNWDYVILPAGSPAPLDTDPGTTTTTNPTVGAGPLVTGTNYEYYVRVHCVDASTPVSAWGGPYAFTSSVCPPADKCIYDFVLFASWNGWEEGTLLTVRQNGANVAQLGPGFTSGETMTVPVALCNNIPFEIYWNNDGGWSGQVGLEVINNFDQTVFEHELFSGGQAGAVLFEGEVDCLHPLCQAPEDLASANGTMTTIDLSWAGPATGDWEYIVLPAGSPAPTLATPGVPTTTNPTVGVPLATPATNYDFYVRLVCENASSDTSEWAGPLPIHSEVCDPADKCVFKFELLSEGEFGFSDNTMTVYQSGVPVVVLGPGFDWTAPDQGSFMVDVPLCPNEPITIVWEQTGWSDMDKGLHVYTPFMEDVYVKGFGEGAPGDTLFTGLVSCDPPPCPKPQNISVSGVGLDSATITWNEMGDAETWEVWVLPYGSPAPTTPGTVVTVNPTPYEGLNSGTPYVVYVRANCQGDGYSTWTGPFVFVTAIANDDCEGAVNVPVNVGAQCVQQVAGTMTGATSSGVAPSCNWGTTPEYDVWYTFTATGATHVISVKDGEGVEMGYAVYEGDDCGNLTEISCKGFSWNDQGSFGSISGLSPGATYHIQVYATWFPEPSEPTSFNVCVSTAASINAQARTDVEDLVQNVLAADACGGFDNVTWKTGSTIDPSLANGIGYFEKGLSNFGIDEGVVLVTGDANSVIGPNIGEKLSIGSWEGDNQLLTYMTDLGINVGSYNDATVLEFDFVPSASKLKFPFIFASEEYGTFQCSFSDAFAFFLTPVDDAGVAVGPTTNLAVVPDTNSPVSVVTIRDGNFSPNYECESVNENYFADYYGKDPGVDLTFALDPMVAPINFHGHTVKMNAVSDVVPDQKYHIKLVIADRGDSGMDSAVFIGAFDIGKPDLGVDLTIAEGNGVCNGESYTITSDLDPDDYQFTWYKRDLSDTEPNPNEFEVVAGQTTVSLTVTESGEYKLNASFGGICEANDSVIVEFYPEVEQVTGNPVQMIVCDADGFATFDLSDNTANVLDPAIVTNPAGYTVSYHLTADDAKDDLNPLPLTGYDNVTQALQEIYVRIVDEKGCVGVKSFSLVVQDLTPFFTVNEDFAICENTSGTISVIPTEPANYDPAVATYTWTRNGTVITDATTSTITVTVDGDYEVTVNNQGCPATKGVTVSVIPTPVPDQPANVVECTSYALPPLSAGNHYFTGTNGTGTELSEGDVIEATQDIFVYAYNDATPECAAQAVFNVKIIPTALVSITETCNGNEYTLEARFDEDTLYNEDNVTFQWTNDAGDNLGSASTLVVTAIGNYNLTVTPSGLEKDCPVTVVADIDNTTCLIPRGISPNGDGSNDSFDLTTLDVKELKIFNRYGQEVYSKRDYTNEWIGQGSNGDELPTGTYYYMFERNNGESKTGWVYINRQD